MKMLQFVLSGKTAFFKKPEVNTYGYFTYGNIHRVALLGIFGAIIGYNGYPHIIHKKEKYEKYPEFYEKLNHLKIAIMPMAAKGYIPKKFQNFNNSIGYASHETGGNLITKQQWLEDPKWKIGVMIEDKEAELLADKVISRRCTYIPYLGTNDHPADIYDACIIDCTEIEGSHKVNSLFYKDKAILMDEEDAEEESDCIFKYEEFLPIELEENFNNYITRALVYTNIPIENYQGKIYQTQTDIITFL